MFSPIRAIGGSSSPHVRRLELNAINELAHELSWVRKVDRLSVDLGYIGRNHHEYDR